MLFNSYAFLLAYLPITLIGFFVLARRDERWGAGWLAASSVFFYGWWDYHYVPLLLGSVVFNYLVAAQIRRTAAGGRKTWLLLGLVGDLAVLAYFKYADFFLGAIGTISGQPMPVLGIVLPAGISFFTFTQIAFLVDTYRSEVREARFVHYLLFVTYFPHLIAGPVLHHKEMMPQFADARNYRPHAMNFAVGIALFTIGLAKKVLIADNLAPFANEVFGAPSQAELIQAWAGVLAYTFQLYFDFSGYSDMALGLSRMLGVRLPLNFDSPYKSVDIIDFWRRWHMTLSRFLRDYLYFPLGGNRSGPLRRYLNLMITMVLGGLWHGAGWNFLVWGGLHGAYLMVNHGWRALRGGGSGRGGLPPLLAVSLTFIATCFAWVFFRATSFHGAIDVIAGMVGQRGVSLPESIGARLGPLGELLGAHGLAFTAGGGGAFVKAWLWIFAAGFMAFFCPNSQQILARYEPALEPVAPPPASRIRWAPGRRSALLLAALFVVCFLGLNRPSEFLYFQF